MAYIPNECSIEEYENVIYSGDAKHRLYVKHGDTIIGTNGDNNASPFASSLILKRRILKNGSKTITLNNFVSQELDLVLHDYKIEDLSEEIEIKIGTFIDSVNDYVYVPIGKFLIQDNPTTDKNKTTYKLRDFSIKFDFYYNAKPLIDANEGKATKLQILKNICEQAGVHCNIDNFMGARDEIGIYDNTITARTYISYLAEQAGKLATINRNGELVFVDLISINQDLTFTSDATIQNALARDFNKFLVEGESEQDGTPTPDAPVEIKTVKGIENFLNVPSSYSLSGEQQITFDKPLQRGIYTIGFTSKTTDGANNCRFILRDINNDWVVDNTFYGISDKTFEVTREVTSISIYSQDTWANSQNKTTTFNELRLNKSDTLQPYTPFGNYLYNKITSEQLYDKNNIDVGKYLEQDGSEITTDVWNVTEYIKISPNVDCIYQGITHNGTAPYSVFYDKNKGFITSFKQQTGINTIKSPSNAYYVRFSLYKGDGVNDTTTFMLNQETTFLTALQGNELVKLGDVKDELDIVTGTLTKRIGKVILDGSENWQNPTQQTENIYRFANNGFTDTNIYKPNSNYKSNIFNFLGLSATSNVEGISNTDGNGLNRLWIFLDINRLNGNATVAEFKTWLSNNPVTLYYELAQPEIIQLDATEIKTFEGTNHITLESGLETDVKINYDVPKIPHIISPNIVEKFTAGDIYKVSKVLFESGVIKYESGNDDNDILYISQDNPYIQNERHIQKLADNINGFEISSFKTGKILGNPLIDAHDLIKVEYDDIIYTTLAQHTFNFKGTMTSTYDTTIEYEAKQSNVSGGGMSSVKKYVKTEINNAEGRFTVEVGKVNSGVDDVKDMANNNSDRISEADSKINDTNTNLETLTGTVSKMTQDTEGWTYEFDAIKKNVETLDGKVDSTDEMTKEIKNYIKFKNGDIILEGTDSKCSLVITKEKISFFTDGNETAYISNNELYINDNTVLRKQSIGKWETKPDADGNLNTRWIG